MKKLIAVAVAALFSTAVFAQAQTAPGQTPSQAPAGDPGKITKPAKMEKMAKPDAMEAKPITKAEKKAARKMKRSEKVGDKPVN
jgi:uncharacterized protein YdeI (BOF family)